MGSSRELTGCRGWGPADLDPWVGPLVPPVLVVVLDVVL